MLFQNSHELSFNIMGLQGNKRKKFPLSVQLSSSFWPEKLEKEVLDLFLSDRLLLGYRAPFKGG